MTYQKAPKPRTSAHHPTDEMYNKLLDENSFLSGTPDPNVWARFMNKSDPS